MQRRCKELIGVAVASVICEMKLCPEIRPFPFKPPVFWSLWAIKHFSPLNFSFKRIVGAYYFQTLPEAPYQDGFYRCFHDLTTGSLNTLSEFGRADGWVDLPIPSKKWGVELLRDGQLLSNNTTIIFPPQGSIERFLTLMNTLCLTLERRTLCRPILVRAFHLARCFILFLFFFDFCRRCDASIPRGFQWQLPWGNVTIKDSKFRNVQEFSLLQTQS